LGQLARIGEDNLRLPVVIADLARHTNARAAEWDRPGSGWRNSRSVSLACIGGGPPCESFGRTPLYREAEQA